MKRREKRKNSDFTRSFEFVHYKRAMGLEPTTFSLATRRSTAELHPHGNYKFQITVYELRLYITKYLSILKLLFFITLCFFVIRH